MNAPKRTHPNKNFFAFGLQPHLHLASQRSLHNAPIFRLLLKVAVNGTHQCDFLNFCGALGLQQALKMRCVVTVPIDPVETSLVR